MRNTSRLALACGLAALLSACGGSSGVSGGGPLPRQSSSPVPTQSSNLQFVFHIPPGTAASTASIGRNGVRPKDFSASTQSVTIAIGTNVLKTADVSASSSLCVAATGGGRSCTVGVDAPNGSDQFTITAYDQPNGTGIAIAQGAVQATVPGQATPLNVTVTGTIVKLALALSNPYPQVGTPVTTTVVVTGLDSDGNVVLGSYASPISLKDSDMSGATTLSTTTISNSTNGNKPVTLSYTGAWPFVSATITATLAGVGSATATFAPEPAFANTYAVDAVSLGSGPHGAGIQSQGPFNITKGPDGNMWAVETQVPGITKIAPDGSMTRYPLPRSLASEPGEGPKGIVVGADKNLWFAQDGNNAIGMITPSGVVTSYPLPQTTTRPLCVALGSDGNVWFFDDTNKVFGSVTTSGVITEYPAPPNASVSTIATGPDGNLWMADGGENAILKVSTSGKVLSTYTLPVHPSQISGDGPYGISAGPDGNVWFTELFTNRVGRITPSGAISEFTLPDGSSYPTTITPGPDGRMWFAGYGYSPGVGRIGYVTVDGKQIQEFMGDGLNIHDIAFDAKGMMWYLAVRLPTGPQEVGTFLY